MLIGKDWKIYSDSLNIILSKRYKKKEGGFGWKIKGYFSSITNAMKALVDQEVRKTELKDLKTIVAKLDKVYKFVEEVGKQAARDAQSILRDSESDAKGS